MPLPLFLSLTGSSFRFFARGNIIHGFRIKRKLDCRRSQENSLQRVAINTCSLSRKWLRFRNLVWITSVNASISRGCVRDRGFRKAFHSSFIYMYIYIKKKGRARKRKRNAGTLREGSPKTIKYNSGLRVTYLAMPDDAFRQVRAADAERNIVSRIIGRRGREKKRDDYSTRDRSYVRASISRQQAGWRDQRRECSRTFRFHVTISFKLYRTPGDPNHRRPWRPEFPGDVVLMYGRKFLSFFFVLFLFYELPGTLHEDRLFLRDVLHAMKSA